MMYMELQMDKKLRLVYAGFGLIFGSLLTTNLALASVTDSITGFNTIPTEAPNSIDMGFDLHSLWQERTIQANHSYTPAESDTTDNTPTPVPAPAAAWLFGSGTDGQIKHRLVTNTNGILTEITFTLKLEPITRFGIRQ